MSVVSIQDAVNKRVEEEKRKRPPVDTGSGDGPPIEFVWDCYQANEVGDSVMYNHLNKGKFVHNTVSGRWLCFLDPHWDLDRDGQALAAIESSLVPQYARLLVEYDKKLAKAEEEELKGLKKKKDAVYSRIKKLRSVTGRKNCMICAASNKDPLTVEPSQMDRHPLLLPAQNGVVDMRTGELRSGRPEDWLTKAAPTEWKGLDEPAPVFKDYLLTSLGGSVDRFNFLHRLCGYAVTGLSKEAVFPVLYGRHGQNGKGTLMEILYDVLGELAGPIQSEMLLASNISKSSSGPSPDIMALKGKRLVWGSETEENARFAAGKVKLLTGRDSLVGRNPNDREQTTFSPTHTLFLLTNSKPHAPSNDSAFFTRIKIISFPLSFVPDPDKPYERKADPDLMEKLQEERSGILAWLVRGYLQYVEKGLSPPRCIIKDTLEYRTDEDVLVDFVEECCETDPEHSEKFSTLYTKYKAWWEDVSGSRRPLTKKKFGILLKDKYESMKSGGAVIYYGLRVRHLGSED